MRRPGFHPWIEKIPWRSAWQPTLVFSPGESRWRVEPDRLQSLQLQRVLPDWVTKHTKKFCTALSGYYLLDFTTFINFCISLHFLSTRWLSGKEFAWKIPWTEEPDGPQFIGLQRIGHDWTCMHALINIWNYLFCCLLIYEPVLYTRILASGDFPGNPVVKTPCFPCRGVGLFPGWRTKIMYAAWCSQINICVSFRKVGITLAVSPVPASGAVRAE